MHIVTGLTHEYEMVSHAKASFAGRESRISKFYFRFECFEARKKQCGDDRTQCTTGKRGHFVTNIR